MKAVNLILSLLVSALIGLAVFEGGLRLIGKGPAPSVLEPHEKLGWAKKKSTSITRKTPEGFKVTYDLNEYGLRDDADMTATKPADTFRVVCLGDSFTMGVTVEQKDLFVDVLESWWGSEGRKIEVINAGTEAYSTDQEAVWLLEYGEAFDPDLVLVLSYENDIFWNGQRAYYGDEKPLFSPSGELETGMLKAKPAKSLFARTALGSLFASGPTPDVFQPAGHSKPIMKEWAPLLTDAPDFLADAVARTEGAFRALKKQCDKIGCPLVVAPIPSHSAVSPEYAKGFAQGALAGMPADKWSADRPIDLLIAAAQAAGAQTLDSRAFLREQFKSGGEELYFQKDWHLNPAGNSALAAFLHDQLDTNALVPATTTPIAMADIPAREEGGTPTWAYVFGTLWAVLGVSFAIFYRREENPLLGFLKVGALLAVIFTIAIGGSHVIGLLPPIVAQVAFILIVLAILSFILWKLGDRVGTITELITAMVSRGHWYLMPLVVILLTVGSLLVVAASSPLAAPFIYTLF